MKIRGHNTRFPRSVMWRTFTLSLLIILAAAYSAIGQFDLSLLYQPTYMPVIDPGEFVDIDFKWDVPGKAQAFLNSGITELKEGSPVVALQNLDESVELFPHWASFYYRGICHKKLRNYKEAAADLTKVLQLQKDCAEAHLALGETYQLQGEQDKALVQYERAVRLRPSFVEAHYRIGSLYFLRHETSRAIRQYEKCIEIDPTYPNSYLGLGLLRFSEKKKDRGAIVYFDKAIEVNPTFKDGLFWRGLAYITLENYEKALEDWDMLVRVNPQNPYVLIYRATLMMMMDEFELAYRDFQYSLLSFDEDEDRFAGQQTDLDKRIDLQSAVSYLDRYGYGLRDDALLRIKKGLCFLITDRKVEAIRNFRISGTIEPSACAFYLTAIGYEHLNRFDSAHYFYNKALNFDRDLFDAYKKRAIFRYELRNWQGSLSDFSEMIRLQPESIMPYRLRGIVRAHMKDYYGCIVDLARVLDNDASDAEAWKTRGYCRQNVKDSAGALADYRQFLQLDKSEAQLFEMVAEGYLQLKDTIIALDVLSEYQRAYPYSSGPPLMMARVYIAMNNFDRAKDAIQKVYDLMITGFRDPDLYFNALRLDGIVEYRCGNPHHAIAKFSEALKINPRDLEVRYYRFKAYDKAGNKRKAEDDLKVLKKMNYRDAATL
jgi:tetratricopeptide (TPR) repeat protein